MKKILVTLTILSTLLFASCQSDFFGNEYRNGSNSGTASGEGFRLRLSVPSNNSSTRATLDSQWGEEYVNTLHLLFFDAGNGHFRGFVVLDEETMPDLHDGKTLDLSAPLHVCFQSETARHLNNHTHYRILAVANIKDFLCGDEWGINPLAGWVAGLTAEVSNITNGMATTINIDDERNAVLSLRHFTPTNRIHSERLLMSAEINKPADVEEVLVPLTRAVVRLDVVLSDRVAAEYELVSASVWNVPQYTSLWHSHTDFSTIMGFNLGAVQRVTYNGATSLNAVPVSSYEHPRFTSHEGFKGILYTFENRQSGIAQDCPRTTAVILGIRCKGSGITYYHRVNVHLPFAAQTLQRNTVHNIRVNHVLGQGASSEVIAYRSNNSQLQVSVNNSDMDNRGVILVDGDNVLVLPTNRIVFSPEGDSREFTIFTHSPTANWRLGVSQLVTDPGISAVLTGHTLTVSATPSVDPRQGFIELEFGNIRARIEIVQTSRNVEFLYLNLQMNDIHWFDATGTPQQMEAPDDIDYVRVTASGEWTARVFNEEVFGFTAHSSSEDNIIRGNPDDIFRLYAISDNADNVPRYGFVVVSLLSNPNINQVLIVRQHGADALRVFRDGTELITKAERTIMFNPTGEPMPINTHVVNVTHAVGALTSNFAYGDNGFTVSKVAVTPQSTTLTFTAPADFVSRSNRLDITSPLGGAVASIWLNQLDPTLTFSPKLVPNIPNTGGTSVPITVESSGMPWTVAITSHNNWEGAVWEPQRAPATLSQTSGNSGQSFTVTFPERPPMNQWALPSVTVTVTAGSITETITILQNRRTYRNLTFRSGGSNRNSHAQGIGNFAVVYNWGGGTNWGYFRNRTYTGSQTPIWGGFALVPITHTWRNILGGAGQTGESKREANFFAHNATATVQSGAHTVGYYGTRGTTATSGMNTPTTATHVFGMNNMEIGNNTTGNNRADAIRDWLQGDERRVLMINSESRVDDFERAMARMGAPYNQFTTVNRSQLRGIVQGTGNNRRYIVPNRGVHNSKLHDWLFRDGPFANGTDIRHQVSLAGYHGSGGLQTNPRALALNGYPDTFIPIIWHPDGDVVFGIDPVLRIVYFGQACMFGDCYAGNGGGAANWLMGSRREANLTLTRNIAAWIAMAAQYGEEFTRLFDPRP